MRSREELKRSHEHLEQQVEARTAELARTNVDLMEEIDQRRQIEIELIESENNTAAPSEPL